MPFGPRTGSVPGRRRHAEQTQAKKVTGNYAWRDSNVSPQAVSSERSCVNLRDPGGAKSGAFLVDPTLCRIVDAWPTLPDAIRRAVLMLVESTN
jgi:hypothetical protein